METITAQQFNSLTPSSSASKMTEFTKKLNNLDVNQGILTNSKTRPQFYHLEKATGKKFTCKKVAGENKWAILRIN